MTKKVDSNKYVELYFNKEQSVYKWKYLPTTSDMNKEQLKETVILIASGIKKYCPKYAISDARENSSVFVVELQEWIAKMVIKPMQISETKKFAILTPKEMMSELSMEQTVDEAVKMVGNIQIRIFVELEEANNWISL